MRRLPKKVVHIRTLVIGTVFSLVLVAPMPALAQNYTGELDNAGAVVYGSADAAEADFFTVLGMVFDILLSVLGVVLLIFILYGGFRWMTASGNTQQAGEARDIIRNAVIGIIILVASWGIAQYVTELISSAVS